MTRLFIPGTLQFSQWPITNNWISHEEKPHANHKLAIVSADLLSMDVWLCNLVSTLCETIVHHWSLHTIRNEIKCVVASVTRLLKWLSWHAISLFGTECEYPSLHVVRIAYLLRLTCSSSGLGSVLVLVSPRAPLRCPSLVCFVFIFHHHRPFQPFLVASHMHYLCTPLPTPARLTRDLLEITNKHICTTQINAHRHNAHGVLSTRNIHSATAGHDPVNFRRYINYYYFWNMEKGCYKEAKIGTLFRHHLSILEVSRVLVETTWALQNLRPFLK